MSSDSEVCKICEPSKIFATLNAYGEHLHKNHVLACLHCNTECPNKEFRDQHMLTQHFQHPCHVCLYTFNTANELAQHYKLLPKKRRLVFCKICKVNCKSVSAWSHCEEKHKYQCPMADYGSYDDKKDFDDHLRLRHHLFACGECYQVFRTTRERARHVLKVHRCLKCRVAQFGNVAEKHRHQSEVHSSQIKWFKCFNT